MTTPARRSRRVTARLRAIAGLPAADDATSKGRTRVSDISFERSHRDTVWIPPDPPRRWFEAQGIEKWEGEGKRRWWR